MNFLLEGIGRGLNLLTSLDAQLLEIILLSLLVSGTATLLAGLLALPLALGLALRDFPGRRLLIGVCNTALAVPAVLIGLLVYLLLSRNGLFGAAGLLFTPWAMIIAQALLALPIVTALSLAAIKGQVAETRDLAYALGAGRWQMIRALLSEARFAFLTALITAFSRVIGETGMTMMVGGNIRGHTRVMTTAIALETMKGNFELGIALGLVLIVVALLVNVLLQFVQGK